MSTYESLIIKADQLLKLCQDQDIKIVTAESCTGGLVAACLTEVPGASLHFDRTFVTYSNAAKTDMLSVSPKILEEHGAVSEAVALAMAEGALKHSAGNLAIAITGIAGPDGGTETKPVGLVHFAFARKGDVETVRHEQKNFGDIGRSTVRFKSVAYALEIAAGMVEEPA